MTRNNKKDHSKDSLDENEKTSSEIGNKKTKQKKSKKEKKIKRKMKFNFKFSKIGIKIVFPFILLILLGLGIFGYMQTTYTNDLLEENFEKSNNEIIEGINGKIMNNFKSIEQQVGLVTSVNVFKELSFYEQDYSNQYITRRKQVKDLLLGFENSNESIENVYFTTETGKTYLYSETDKSNQAPTETDWFKSAGNSDEDFAYGDVYYDDSLEKYIITLSKGIYNGKNLIGVIGIDVALSDFVMTIVEDNPDLELSIITKDGITVASYNDEVVNTKAITNVKTLWNQMEKNDSGFVNYDYKNVTKYGLFSTNSLTNWQVLLTIPESKLLEKTDKVVKNAIIIIAILLFISIILAFFISKFLTDNVSKLEKNFAKAANGDLTVNTDLKTNDELESLSKSFNDMINSIGNLVSSIDKSSIKVESGAQELLDNSKTVSRSINEIARTIDEVAVANSDLAQEVEQNSSNITDLSDKLDEVDKSTNEIAKLSESSTQLNKEGIEHMEELIETNEQTANSINKVSSEIDDLKDSASKISGITEKIDNIAEQTNLLALNASIEAARAGEAGKGFAVVADEIRKLAEDVSVETQEIGDLIKTIVSKTDETAQAMGDTEEIIEEQNSSVKTTYEIFNNILNSIEKLAKRIDDIKENSEEINYSKDEILSSTENISAVSEEVSASTEEVSATAQEISSTTDEFIEHVLDLDQLSEDMVKEVKKFKIND